MTTEQTHRANVVGDLDDCSGAVLPGEVLIGRDNGQYLGDFSSLYHPSARFDVEYPVGWTNATWYEQPAAKNAKDPSCTCVDCRGPHTGRMVSQRQPDDSITPNDATLFDFWDYAVNPQHYTGIGGCNIVFDTSYSCVDANPPHTFHRGLCQPVPGAYDFNEEPACWPLVPFALANPSSRIRVVTDTSGPTDDPCVQDELALEIDFAGNGAEGATFVGEGGGYDADRCGADSSEDNGWSGSRRSATNWTITPWHVFDPSQPDPPDGSCWRVRFWVKAVPDPDDFVCEEYDFTFHTGFWPFGYAETTIAGAKTISLTDEWQLFDCTWRAENPNLLPVDPAFPEPITNVPLSLQTLTTSDQLDQFRPFYQRRGRVHVKHVSVTPCSMGVHVKRYSAQQL